MQIMPPVNKQTLTATSQNVLGAETLVQPKYIVIFLFFFPRESVYPNRDAFVVGPLSLMCGTLAMENLSYGSKRKKESLVVSLK